MRVLFSAENCDSWFAETFVKFSGQSDADKSANLQVGFLNLDIDTVINALQVTSPHGIMGTGIPNKFTYL